MNNLLIEAFNKIALAYEKDDIFFSVICLIDGTYKVNLSIDGKYAYSINIADSNINHFKLNECLKEFLVDGRGNFWYMINDDFYKDGLYRTDSKFSYEQIEHLDKLLNSSVTNKLRAINKLKSLNNFSSIEELIIKMYLAGI
jgi:hypothetical protein